MRFLVMKTCPGLFLFAGLSCGAPQPERSASNEASARSAAAAAVLRQAQARGAAAVVDSMFHDPAFDDVVTSGIGSGDSLWLVVARTLKPASDAAISESLEMSLGVALPRN